MPSRFRNGALKSVSKALWIIPSSTYRWASCTNWVRTTYIPSVASSASQSLRKGWLCGGMYSPPPELISVSHQPLYTDRRTQANITEYSAAIKQCFIDVAHRDKSTHPKDDSQSSPPSHHPTHTSFSLRKSPRFNFLRWDQTKRRLYLQNPTTPHPPALCQLRSQIFFWWIFSYAQPFATFNFPSWGSLRKKIWVVSAASAVPWYHLGPWLADTYCCAV
jgi:hypothetical protein